MSGPALVVLDDTGAVPMVSFVTPNDCVCAAEAMRHFAVRDALILAYPVGVHGAKAAWWVAYGMATTDSAAVRGLFPKTQQLSLGNKYVLPTLHVPTRPAMHKAQAKCEKEPHARAKIMAALGTKHALRTLAGLGDAWLRACLRGTSAWVFKELPNVWGGTLAVLAFRHHDGTPADVDVYRVKVKLGTSRLSQAAAGTIANDLIGGNAAIQLVVAALLPAGAVVRVHNVVATTRPLSEGEGGRELFTPCSDTSAASVARATRVVCGAGGPQSRTGVGTAAAGAGGASAPATAARPTLFDRAALYPVWPACVREWAELEVNDAYAHSR